jgi:predicted transcriptional regulator
MAKLYKSYAFMRLRFVTQRKTEQEIAEELGVNQSIINRWLHKHNLKRAK